MHLQMQRDICLDNHKFATVYPAMYCRTPNTITLRHFSMVDKWIYAARKRYYAAGIAGCIGAKKYIFTVFLKGKC